MDPFLFVDVLFEMVGLFCPRWEKRRTESAGSNHVSGVEEILGGAGSSGFRDTCLFEDIHSRHSGRIDLAERLVASVATTPSAATMRTRLAE